METFDWIPSYTPQQKKQPRLLKAQFGDGYTQRAKDGINNNPASWDLKFSARDQAEAAAIIAFLDARGGAEPFLWTDTNGVAGQYTCEQYGATRTSPLLYEVTATFVEDFSPA